MFTLDNPTEHAKRLILEAPDTTRKTCGVLLVSLILACLHVLLSFMGTGNSWTCEVDNQDPKHDYICKELRSSASCQVLTGPLKAEILLDVEGEVKASAYIVCPWENAMSELRLCFALGAGLCLLVGLLALAKEDKKLAELHTNAAYFFSLLLAIAATFDLYAISDSKTNNYSLCNLTNEFSVEDGVTGEMMDCSHELYNFTAYVGYLAAASVIVCAYYVKDWKENLVLDSL